jgi:glutamine amidotransferase
VIAVLDYGMGNLRSVQKALEHVGAEPEVTRDPARIRAAEALVLPGVGAFPKAMEAVREHGLDELIAERRAAGVPVLGICLGMQLLFGESEEGGSGLGLLEGGVVRLRARQVPHMGWNTLSLSGATEVLDGLEDQDVYFAHSYGVDTEDAVVATVDHEGRVVAAVERGALAGVQFHPERSGAAGARVLENVLRWSSAA